VISQESSDGEERNQNNEDNPNIDAHQSRLLPPVRTPDTPQQRKPRAEVPGAFKGVETMKEHLGITVP